MMVALALAACLIWAVLIFGRAGYWRCRETDFDWQRTLPEGQSWPSVIAIVPARNEAEVIETSLAALLAQDYPGEFRIFLVDDASSDGTAARARALAEAGQGGERLRILTNQSLPSGWTGKLWAMNSGFAASEAEARPSDFVLFCDADIALAPDTVRGLVATARREGRVLVSLMAKLSVDTPAERALIPAFVYFFAQLYPFARVNDAASRLAAAAGGCMLVERAALLRAGGLEKIRAAIIDDCAMGRLLKAQGPIRLALTERAISLRVYAGPVPIQRMITRSAFAELNYSSLLLVVALLGLALTYLVPPIALLFGEGLASLLGLVSSLAMLISFLPILRFYRLSPFLALTLPAIAVFYGVCTAQSAWLHWRGRGGAWKGRYQALSNAGSEP